MVECDHVACSNPATGVIEWVDGGKSAHCDDHIEAKKNSDTNIIDAIRENVAELTEADAQ